MVCVNSVCRRMELFNKTKMKVFLIPRLCATFLLVLTAFLVGIDSQTELVFFIQKKASFTDLNALVVLVFVSSFAAAYNLVQLCRHYSIFQSWFTINPDKSIFRTLAWLDYLLDQITVYVVFSTTSAAFTECLLAVTGAKSMQWMKLCDKFTRFCFQIGGALAIAYLASLLLILVASISAFNLFRLYSPKHFLLVKPGS